MRKGMGLVVLSILLVSVLVFGACSQQGEVKEVVKEVPVEKEVVREVVKEVPVEKEVVREVVKEVPVERVVQKEVVKEVPVERVVQKEVVKEVVKEVAPAVKLPEAFRTTVLPLGSLGYAISLPMGEAVKQTTGIPMRFQTGGSEVARVLPIRAREADFTLLHSGNMFFVSHGLEDYASEGWGPQPLRYIWVGTTGGNTWVTRGDAGINTVADLKGKRVLVVPGNVFFTRGEAGALAFGGLTWDDVKQVQVPSSGAGFKAILEGSGDAMLLSTSAAGAYELEASPHGVKFLPFPKADKEGWARMVKIAPYLSPFATATGAGLSETNTLECGFAPYFWGSYTWVPDLYAYTLTKGLWEGVDLYKDKHPELKHWTLDNVLKYKILQVPYHTGTVQYLKDIGKWTADMEQWQTKMVKLESDRQAAWGQANKAAAEQKIAVGSPQFKALWEKWLDDNKLKALPIID